MTMQSFGRVIGYSAWVALTGFALPALIIGIGVAVLVATTDMSLDFMQSSVGLLGLFALQFMLGFVFMMVLPVFVQKKSWVSIVKILGLHKSPTWTMVGYSLVALVGYFITSALLQVLAQQFLPGYDVDEVQELGFSTDIVGWELVVAGLALVVLAPVFEELIFRGYLFGVLRPITSFLVVSLVVSTIFGIAHGQLNVALDVFVLSMFMCLVREKTGTIWGPILMHMFKNGLAFTLLFIVKIDTSTLSFIGNLK